MSQSHRISLTPFERYQYWETQDGHPNQITAVFDFQGQIRPDILIQAMQQVRQRHPLFSAVMELKNENPKCWKLDPESKVPLTLLPCTELDFEKIPQLPAIHPSCEPAGRLTVRFDSQNRCQWILQTHHAHCDGVGGLQIIRELLQCYHARFSEAANSKTGNLRDSQRGDRLQLREMPLEKLKRRNQWQGNWKQFWLKPLQLLGLFGASKFLLRQPVDLTKANPNRRTSTIAVANGPQANPNLHEDSTESMQHVSFSFAKHQLSPSQTKRLRQLARQSKVTVNSMLLGYWMIALQQWMDRQSQVNTTGSMPQWYRLVIPTNERTVADLNLSACNRVSLVYVDRQTKELDYPESLIGGIHYEMSVMRKLNLTRTMLLALRIMNWFPGLLKRHARTPKCWATSYVTNLGGVLDRLNLPHNAAGESQVGELTIKGVLLLPPLRPGTPVALAVNQYAKCLNFTVHYDAKYLDGSDAKQLLRYFLNRILTLS